MISIAVIDDHPVFSSRIGRPFVKVDEMVLLITAASVEGFDARVTELPSVPRQAISPLRQ